MKSYLYLTLLLVAFSFTACEKTTDEFTVTEPTPEERFDNMQKPLVLFHYANRQIETGQEVGWIIDRQGWVKTYERTLLPGITPSTQSEVLAALELQELYDSASEGLFQIGKAELVERLDLSRSISDQHLSPTISNAEEKIAEGLFAYNLKSFQDRSAGSSGHGECQPGMAVNTTISSYTQLNRLIVDLAGPHSRSVTSERGQKLHQWLLDINRTVTVDF